MPKVRALVRCFVGNTLRNEGDIFEHTSAEQGIMELVDVPPQKADEVEQVVPEKKLRKARTSAS